MEWLVCCKEVFTTCVANSAARKWSQTTGTYKMQMVYNPDLTGQLNPCYRPSESRFTSSNESAFIFLFFTSWTYVSPNNILKLHINFFAVYYTWKTILSLKKIFWNARESFPPSYTSWVLHPNIRHNIQWYHRKTAHEELDRTGSYNDGTTTSFSNIFHTYNSCLRKYVIKQFTVVC